jgi:hypothetical protein
MKPKRKTVDDRFEAWWKTLNVERRGAAVMLSISDLKSYVRMGYGQGWRAHQRWSKRNGL